MATSAKRKAVSRTALKKKADRLWSKAIRERDVTCRAKNYRGFPCGGYLQGCHIIGRKYLATRWLLENGLALCGAHHTYFTHHPLEWEDWIIGRIGDQYKELREKAMAGFIGSPPYEEIIAELNNIKSPRGME